MAILDDPRLEKRFWKAVRKSDGCWLWSGKLDPNGYAIMVIGSYPSKNRKVSRLAYERFCGPLVKGLVVCHRCDNPACVRPDHLFQATQRDNIHDAIRKGRFNCERNIAALNDKRRAQTHCKHGHEYTPENTLRNAKSCRYCRECRRQTSRQRCKTA